MSKVHKLSLPGAPGAVAVAELAELRALAEQNLAETRALRADLQGVLRARAGLDAGRARAIEKAQKFGAYTRNLVVDLAAADVHAGRPERGRAGRIAKKLNGLAGEAHVRKILRTLSSVRDSSGSNVGNTVDQGA